MKRSLVVLFSVASCLVPAAFGQLPFASPFAARAELSETDGREQLRFRISVPEGHYLYSQELKAELLGPEGAELRPLAGSKPKWKYDELLEKDVEVFDHDLALGYGVVGRGQRPLKVRLSYQGCSSSVCFMPQSEVFEFDAATGEPTIPLPEGGGATGGSQTSAKLDELLAGFEVGGKGVGYMPPTEFLTFLEDAQAGRVAKEEDGLVQRVFRRYGLLAVLLLLIPLGFLLNLTPCVLPMIPINLAIIGAGAQAGSRKRGFALGSVYGAGMAAVYGVLGLVVLLGGRSFGALNASPWFNLAIMVVFVVLALAMFDFLVIDLSRFRRRAGVGTEGRRAPFATAFLLGGMAALLAGACVAPVLISVLVLAANLMQTNRVALLLPFMLGVGMALPWPFAGAGLSFLPKPGGWMDWVKRIFGVLILGVAIYFGVQAFRQFRLAAGGAGDKETNVAAALQQGLERGKPVFLDFWAISCAACKKMERDVFPEPAVARKLEEFVFAGVQTDLPDREDVTWAVRTFEVLGNPTYVVLVPKADAK